MKKTLIMILLYLGMATFAKSQIRNPVHWSYGLKKVTDNKFEVHLLATMDSGWHIYAQKQLPQAVALPTEISLDKQEGLTLIGKPIEIGKKDEYTIPEAGVTNYEYADKVDFVQQVTIKPNLKEIKGKVIWQACTHKECLPPQTLNFTVPVN